MPTTPVSQDITTPRVILDSNVWLDILVFNDATTRPIHAALERGALIAIIDARCLAEFARVIDYPQFVERGANKQAALAQLTRLTEFVTPSAAPENTARLPLCRDRDDQKFLELAYEASADWLVSKDRALLKLARPIARGFKFRIAQPGPFVAAACTLPLASALERLAKR